MIVLENISTRHCVRICISVFVDFMPIIISFIGMGFSVLHNLWATDETMGNYFPLNPSREIYFETHIYFLGDRITLCLSAITLILLCLPRWSGLLEMYIHIFKVVLLLEFITLIDYLITGNRDLAIKEFDSNTIKLFIYGLYIIFFFGKRLFEKIKYENS